MTTQRPSRRFRIALLCSTLLGLVLLGVSAAAVADAAVPVRIKLALELPFTTIWLGSVHHTPIYAGQSAQTPFGLAATTFGGGSLRAELFERVLLEVYGGGGILFMGSHVGVRTGVLFTLLDRRAGGPRGWQLQLPVQIGYERLERADTMGSDSGFRDTGHYVTAGTALDSTYWLRRRFGLNLRLQLTGLVRVGGTTWSDSHDLEEMKGGVALGLLGGLAF